MSMRILVGVAASTIAAVVTGSLFFIGHAQTLPAPTVDRVGFPSGYKDAYKLFYVFDNYQNRQIRKVYANTVAAAVTPGEVFNFPYGSILLFESYSVQLDARGEPVLDIDGRFIPNAFTTIFVMRKERGFGTDYKELRNGEWEYASYRPDGSLASPPTATGSCAQCHLNGGALTTAKNIGAQWDYVFRPDLFFSSGSGALPQRGAATLRFRSVHDPCSGERDRHRVGVIAVSPRVAVYSAQSLPCTGGN
jgi:hypothetical protein